MATTWTPEELKNHLERGERVQLIDVRSPGEYAAEHIPGAMNLPLEQVDARLDDLNVHEPVVLICQSGRRAEMCAAELKHHRDDVILLEGGTQNWLDKGFETVHCQTTRWSLERQVRLGAGLMVLAGTVLSLLVAPAWIYLAMFVGAGLTFAGATNICGMAALLAKLPWNQPKRPVRA